MQDLAQIIFNDSVSGNEELVSIILYDFVNIIREREVCIFNHCSFIIIVPYDCVLHIVF